MNIQGIGQSFSAYQSMSIRGSQGMNSSFEPPSADSIMENDDANLDGVLTVDETPMSEEMFSDADSDSDGQLNTSELEEMLSNGPPPPPIIGGGGEQGMMGGGMSGAQSILDAEDTDEDGSISSEESSLSSEVFSLLDTNKDGVISQDEIEAAQPDKQENMNMMQGLSSNQTVSQDQAINVYRQVMESSMTNFSSTDYADSNLGSFLQTMA
ncbi:MAG: EF-hand domain-containing protein [Desulfobacula sp.]|jgi:Ca2+-binding EF-hand superfamily protein|nr:EF-hand domain-containing protein [Desulfobacula sp.]